MATTSSETSIMQYLQNQIEALQLENYGLREKNAELEKELDYLNHAIEMVQREYELKSEITDYIREGTFKVQCCHEIRRQVVLLKLSEREC